MRKVVATPAGVRTRTDLELRVREAEGELLSALDAGEREMFRSLLRRVACDLRNIEPETDPCDVAEQVLAYVSPHAHGKARARRARPSSRGFQVGRDILKGYEAAARVKGAQRWI